MRPVRAALCAVAVLSAAAAHAAPPELPIPNIGVTVTAPSPRGPWTMRLVNEDDRPLRIPADIRLLRFSITPPGAAGARLGRPIRCDVPRPLRPRAFPEARALYLAPGQAYEETFDPQLFCFGAREAKALAEGAVVRAFFGWGPDPYAVEGLRHPARVASLRELAAPASTIGPGSLDAPRPSHDGGRTPVTSARGEAMGEPAELAAQDEKAPRLTLEAPRFVEAASPHGLVARFVARNTGHRPMRVALRAHMLSFAVEGPDGPFRCEIPECTRDATPPDLLRTLAPGAAATLAVRLDEACRNESFRRPGLYRVTATLHAGATGSAHGVPAFTAVVPAARTTLVRLLSGQDPFYRTPPEAKPAPSARDSLDPEARAGSEGLSLPPLLLRREHLPPLR